MKEMRPIHPISILRSLKQLAFLLVIPLFRGLLVAISGGGVREWISGAKVDIFVLLFAILVATFFWSQKKYKIANDGITVEKGVFVKESFYIPYNKMATISLTSPFLLKYLGVVRLKADTHAGFNITTDIDFYIHKKDSLVLRDSFLKKHDYKKNNAIYRAKSIYIILFSALISNSAVGVSIAYTFFSQGGKILGEELEMRLLSTVSTFLNAVAKGVPPALGLIGILFIIGWIISFIKILFRYQRFRATRMSGAIWITGGIFVNHDSFLQIKDINYLDIKQTLLTKIFSLAMTYIYCTGYEKNEKSAPVLIPAASKKSTGKIINQFLKEFKISSIKIKPKLFVSISSYIVFPGVLIIVTYLITGLLSYFLVKWRIIIAFIGFIASIPFIWMLFIKIFDFATTGIGIKANSLTLCYSTNFSLHTIIMHKDKISKIVINQKNWQKGFDLCDLTFYSFSENRKSHKVKCIDKLELINYLKKYDILFLKGDDIY